MPELKQLRYGVSPGAPKRLVPREYVEEMCSNAELTQS